MLAFFEGTPAYNLANLGVGVVGLALTVGSLLAARRAARSAAGARTEAEQAKQLIRGVAMGAELADLRGYLREAVSRLDDGSGDVALIYITLVGERLARAGRLPTGDRVATVTEWRALGTALQELHDAVYQRHSLGPPPTRHEMSPYVGQLLSLIGTLATMQAAAEGGAAGG